MANQDFIVVNFCLLSEKEKCRMKALFEGDLSPSRTAKGGYSATFLDWVTGAKGRGEEGGPCTLDTTDNAPSFREQMQPWR